MVMQEPPGVGLVQEKIRRTEGGAAAFEALVAGNKRHRLADQTHARFRGDDAGRARVSQQSFPTREHGFASVERSCARVCTGNRFAC